MTGYWPYTTGIIVRPQGITKLIENKKGHEVLIVLRHKIIRLAIRGLRTKIRGRQVPQSWGHLNQENPIDIILMTHWMCLSVLGRDISK